MTEEKLPRWKKPAHIKASVKYRSNNYRTINIALNKNTETDLIDIYDSIPNKSAWFKECLRKYAEEHK